MDHCRGHSNDPSTFGDTVRDLREVNRASAYAGFQSQTPHLDRGLDHSRTGETVGRDWRVVTSSTTIPGGNLFKHDIESKLPYYEVRKTGHQVEDEFTF